jgi:hypothetical protein
MVRDGALRFAVGTPDGPTSSPWWVWFGKDGSAFISTRTPGGHLQVSLHASGRWRIVFNHLDAVPRIGAPGGDQTFDKFAPGPEIMPGVRHGVMIVIPWLAVGLPPVRPPEQERICWLPPLAEGRVACVALFLTTAGAVVDDAIASATGPEGAGVSIKHTVRAARPEEVEDWTDMATRAGLDRAGAPGTTAEDDTKGFAVGEMPDGTRWLLDLRIPPRDWAP